MRGEPVALHRNLRISSNQELMNLGVGEALV